LVRSRRLRRALSTSKPQKIEHFNAVIEAINTGRDEILRLHRTGEIHDRVVRDMESYLDLHEMIVESRAG
jgi:hypothetical protein